MGRPSTNIGKCKVDGCLKNAEHAGMCKAHYLRVWKYGDPHKVKRSPKLLIDFTEVNGCFECTSHYRNPNGYPTIWRNSKHNIMSRFIYEQCFGEIPKGLVVRHKCDNPTCINPEHLELGTMLDNSRDSVIRGRNAKGEKNGHSKLTSEKVREIRVLLDKGENLTSLSEKFRISKSSLCDIRARRTWKHVE
jgi:hypothetical protein